MLRSKKKKNLYALVTGAAGLLGYYHSQALLELGYDLILTDINTKNLYVNFQKLKKFKKKNKILLEKLDVSDENNIKFLIDKYRNKYIYALINNASINPVINKSGNFNNSGKLEEISVEEWNNHLNIGLTGSMLCSKYFGYEMSKKKGGIIINVASDLSVIAPNHAIYKKNNFKPVTYSVVKHGLIGLTKYLATYWPNQNVRCNAISPGPVLNGQPKAFINKLKKQIPMNRLANKNEYVGAIKFLCSKESKYMNGHNLILDGGRSIW